MGKAARKLSGAALAEFNVKHPRGAGGRFVKAGGVPSAPDVPSAPAPGRARARLGLASKVDMGSALEALRAKKAAPVSGDREAVDELLRPMTVAQLDEVGAKFGISTFGRTKAERARQLRESLVGSRLDHDAIMRVDLSANLGGLPAPAPQPAPKGRARAALSGAASPSSTSAVAASSVRDGLRSATSTAEAEQYLAGLKLSVADLKRLAGELDVPAGGGGKGIRANLVKIFATGRLVTDAVTSRPRAAERLRASGPKA